MNEPPRGLHQPPRNADEPPPRPNQGPVRRAPERRDEEAETNIDAALDKAMARPPVGKPDVLLKRHWDDDLEAELEASLQGFDESSYDVSRSRTRAADRAHAPKSGIGQEERGGGPQKAKVIGIKGKSVFLDLGAKSEGVVPVEQFGENLPNKDDVIEVMFDRFDPTEGLLHMSLKGAAVEANWENLRKGLTVEARITKEVKGGLEVDVDGIRGFMPISQVEIGRTEDAKPHLNQRYRVVVTEANQRERNLVVSRRELLEREREELREKTWAALEEGQVREGVVRSVKSFGAFVDIGGVDGLLHVADMSWTRAEDAAQLVGVGQKVQVKVLKIDRQTSKINLGLKQLMASPWDNIEDKYHRGQTVKGKVTRLMDFGAFVQLEPGVEGLIHISELSPKRVHRVRDIVQPDQEVEVRILQIDPEAKKIGLSLRQAAVASEPAEPEPEAEDEAPPVPKPPRKVPLKGGLGDGDTNPFQR